MCLFLYLFRTQRKAEYLMSLESSEGLLDAMGSQALARGAYHSPEAIAQKIDSVSATDVANVRLFSFRRILTST